MRVKLEPDTAFIGKKFAYIFLVIIFGLNALTFIWFFLFSNLKWHVRGVSAENWFISISNWLFKKHLLLIFIKKVLKMKL